MLLLNFGVVAIAKDPVSEPKLYVCEFCEKFEDEDVNESVVRIGLVSSKLREIGLKYVNTDNDSETYGQLIESLEELIILADSIHLDQQSLIANTNLLSMSQTQAGIRLLMCAVRASLARNESRGLHQLVLSH